MANKYIRHGETFNGDGTTSAAATSNGGAGAWNNINVMEGTAPAYGVLAAGDVVYIRSKDAGGADITLTLTVSINLGSAAASSTALITWVVDGGSVWTGITGTVKYLCASSYTVTTRSYNLFKCDLEDRFEIAETNAGSGDKTTVTFGANSWLENVYLNLSSANTSWGARLSSVNDGGCVRLTNVHISSAARSYGLLLTGQFTRMRLVNPRIELLSAVETDPVFYLGPYGANVEVIGGRIYGSGATSGVPIANIAVNDTVVGGITMIGTQYPKTMSLVSAYPVTSRATRIDVFGNDGGGGAATAACWGEAVSRSDLNHPTLSAYLPDSNETKWSWKLYPANASLAAPAHISSAKYFTDTPSAKTVTLKCLIGNAFSAINKSTMWIELSYTDDATGEQKFVSSRQNDAAALSASTDIWSIDPPSWGATTLVKGQMAVTTPTSVRQNTLMTVVAHCTAKSSSVFDILFLCPDFAVT